MPLRELTPIGVGSTEWAVWGTTVRVVVSDPARLDTARRIVTDHLAAVDAACSRFRPDSELSRLAAAPTGRADISPLLAELVQAALTAAETTDGAVDPTVGRALIDAGYDRDLDLITDASPDPIRTHPTWTWRDVNLSGTALAVPPGCVLDLGATAKAWTADRCARAVAAACDCAALIALGGDIATAGHAPDGWSVLVQDGSDQPSCVIALPSGAALATSSTISRTWTARGALVHHILDPRTAAPAAPVWRTASVVSDTCVTANTLSTAALVDGVTATRRLRAHDVAARLVAADGTVVRLGGWPAAETEETT
jgi:thiamine biosynthesis lipoprotein